MPNGSQGTTSSISPCIDKVLLYFDIQNERQGQKERVKNEKEGKK
jgi:hypothetical protein